jgi:hypothetical protein
MNHCTRIPLRPLAALLAVALLGALPAGGALAAKPDAARPAKLKKNEAYVAKDFKQYGVVRIAMAPVTSFDRNEEAERMARGMIERGLAPLKYRFQGQTMTMDLVRKGEVEDDMTRLHDDFLKGEPLDSAAVANVAARVPGDALMFAHVSQWERFIVDPSARGQSFTQVGIDFALYSLKDGTLLWRGNFLQKGDGPYNEPAANETPDRDPGGNAVARAGRLEPPPFPEVLDKLMERVARSLPPPPATP